MSAEALVIKDVPLNEHTLTPGQMQNLHCLIQWIDGYKAGARTGDVPGHFELVMLYRTLASYQGRTKTK